jgi:RHH-type rel operon transcriptional repressor/antitoxin RelB
MIENGIGAMEETWLPPAVLEQVRSGALPPLQDRVATADLFGDQADE